MPVSALRQRIKDQSLTPAIVATALGLQQDIERTIDGPSGGRTYERIEAWLDDVEKTGYTPGSITPQPDPRPGCTKAMGGVCACAVCGRERVEAQARWEAWNAADRVRVLAERTAYTARAIQLATERIETGNALKALREDAGLTLRELGVMIGFDFSILSRFEAGKPLGVNTDLIKAGYSALTAMNPKTRKAASK